MLILRNNKIARFQHVLEKGACFYNISNKNTPGSAFGGALRAWQKESFLKYVANRIIFLEPDGIHISQSAPIWLFEAPSLNKGRKLPPGEMLRAPVSQLQHGSSQYSVQ